MNKISGIYKTFSKEILDLGVEKFKNILAMLIFYDMTTDYKEQSVRKNLDELDNVDSLLKHDAHSIFSLVENPFYGVDNETYLKIRDFVLSLDTKGKDTINEIFESILSDNDTKGLGVFFTPQCLSTITAQIARAYKADKQTTKVYDPTCGQGNLLLGYEALAREAGEDCELYGQEINPASANIAIMNSWLKKRHGKVEIGDTLGNPRLWNKKPFDVIVSNPPYSVPWNPDIPEKDPRTTLKAVLAPKSKADWAFVMHSIDYMAEDGIGVFIMFPGTLYRGGAEQKIREYLCKSGYLEAVIQMPANLFLRTSIGVDIVVLRKGKTDDKVLFYDASGYGTKAGKIRNISDEEIEEFIEDFSKKQTKVGVSQVVSYDDIEKEDYKFTPSTYIQQAEEEEPDLEELNEELMTVELRRLELQINSWKHMDMLADDLDLGIDSKYLDRYIEKINDIIEKVKG